MFSDLSKIDVGIFGPRRTKKSNFCIVEGCESKASTDLRLRFHKFPKADKTLVEVENYFGQKEKIDKFKAWANALAIKNVKFIKSYSTVCSLHFKSSDYTHPGLQGDKKLLKKNAVPSQFLPSKSARENIVDTDEERLARRLKRDEKVKQLQKKSNLKVVENFEDNSTALQTGSDDQLSEIVFSEQSLNNLKENGSENNQKDSFNSSCEGPLRKLDGENLNESLSTAKNNSSLDYNSINIEKTFSTTYTNANNIESKRKCSNSIEDDVETKRICFKEDDETHTLSRKDFVTAEAWQKFLKFVSYKSLKETATEQKS